MLRQNGKKLKTMNDFQFDANLRYEIKLFLEKLLITACNHQAKKLGITRSKYGRYAIINQLLRDGYPLKEFSDKFDDFDKLLKRKDKNKAMTAWK
jgi:hypothetical protein